MTLSENQFAFIIRIFYGMHNLFYLFAHHTPYLSRTHGTNQKILPQLKNFVFLRSTLFCFYGTYFQWLHRFLAVDVGYFNHHGYTVTQYHCSALSNLTSCSNVTSCRMSPIHLICCVYIVLSHGVYHY